MSEMCITQFVFGSYTKYIPLYIYSILRHYPDYFVKIFVGGKLTPGEADALGWMPSGNYEIQQMYQAHKVRKGVWPKYIRRLFSKKEFEGFKYVYHGDVDYIIIPERPGLMEQHVAHMRRTELPYSNAIRPGTKRVTGLHFIDVEPYYEKMGKILEYYAAHPDEVEKELVKTSDEYWTYRVLAMGIGLGSLPFEYFRPEHGVHLALWRKSKLVKKTLKDRIDFFLNQKEVVRAVLNDPTLTKVCVATRNQSLLDEVTRCRLFFDNLTPEVKKQYGL